MATDPPSVTVSATSGERRNRSPEASRVHPNTGTAHAVTGASNPLGHADGSDRSRLALPGHLPADIRPRADCGTVQMCLRADAARARTAASFHHEREYRD